MSKTELPFVTLEYKKPIVYINFTKAVTIDEQQILELIEIRNRLVNYEPHLVLTTYNAAIDFTEQARKVAANAQHTATSIAHAVVVKWLGQRFVTGAYKEIDKPHYPIEIFSEEEKAVEWLLTHLPKEN